MRLIRVGAPDGMADLVGHLAFNMGIPEVSIHQERQQKPDQPGETRDVIDIAAATPEARAFIDELLQAPFFDPPNYSVIIRQPRSIVRDQKPTSITWPLVEPAVNIYQELWQFSHITTSFVGRVLVVGILLAHGVIEDRLLFMIAGLLFVPFLHLMLAISYGLLGGEMRLAAQGLLALAVGVGVLFLSGVITALASSQSLMYNESAPLLTSSNRAGGRSRGCLGQSRRCGQARNDEACRKLIGRHSARLVWNTL